MAAVSPSALTHSPAWRALQDHRETFDREILREADAPHSGYVCDAAGWRLDYGRHWVVPETLSLLLDLVKQQRLADWRQQMFDGQPINATERRAVLHTALRARADDTIALDGHNIVSDVHASAGPISARKW